MNVVNPNQSKMTNKKEEFTKNIHNLKPKENSMLTKESAKISKNDKSHLGLFQQFPCDACYLVFTSSEMLNEHQIQCKFKRIMRIS